MPDDFLQRMQATFVAEAHEHLQTLSDGLLRLERAIPPQEGQQELDRIFRAAHSLKGAARAVEMTRIETLCQSLEDVFAGWRTRQSTPPFTETDGLHRAIDAMLALLGPLDGRSGTAPSAEPAAIGTDLHAAGRPVPPPAPPWAGDTAAPSPPHRTRPGLQPATVRISLDKLTAQLVGAEEMLGAKQAAGHRLAEIRVFAGWIAEWRKAWQELETDTRHMRQRMAGGQHPVDSSGRVTADPGLARVLDFLDWGSDTLRAAEGRLGDSVRAAQQEHDAIGKLVDDLLDSAKRLLLLPFSSIVTPFSKLVRDQCRDQGKEADLTISGGHIEIDKLILDELKDPIVHMLRNAVDHAIEPAAHRLAAGKPPRATLTLALSQRDDQRVHLRLTDDGSGIDVDALKAAALHRGLLTEDEVARLDDSAAVALALRPELSTRSEVTALSGRGLGLAIVQETVDRLGGEIEIHSSRGAGTSLSITVPTVRSTFRGVLCEAAGQAFLISTVSVEHVARVRREDIRTLEGHDSVMLGGRLVGLGRLTDILELRPTSPPAGEADGLQILHVRAGAQSLALAVDVVLDEQEVLVKPLRRPLCRVRNVAAAAMLEGGRIVPILHVPDLLLSARRVAGGSAGLSPPSQATLTPPRHASRSILLAEDSITSRMLLKTILESAGHTVKTAVDGLEAFALLRAETFDLLISDVEMPRLNGFDLTARVRADVRLSKLPVILVTALASRADRERGFDVGASAYIAKSGFDQEHLIEAVTRLS